MCIRDRFTTVALNFDINTADGVARCLQFTTDTAELTWVMEGDCAIVLGLG